MVREYSSREVAPDVLKRVMLVQKQFPSAGKTQNQRLLLVTDSPSVAQATYQPDLVLSAPRVIAVISDTSKLLPRYGVRGFEVYSISDGAFAGMLLHLAAINEGLGSCWIQAFNEEAMREALQLSPLERPIGILTLGYPK